MQRAVFPLPQDRTQVVEYDAGGANVPESLRVFTFTRDAAGRLYHVGEPVLLVGAPAAFLARAFECFR